MANHRDEWLLFLRDPAVPPTNNHAEQMLRPAVITRKVGGCNKNLWGSLVHSVLASIMVSCHRQGKRFLDLARQLGAAMTQRPSPSTRYRSDQVSRRRQSRHHCPRLASHG